MILGDAMISGRIEKGELGVSPVPPREHVQPASLDVRLGAAVYNPATGVERTLPEGEGLTLSPGQFVLGHTVEVIELPSDLAAQLAGRSTFGRLGIAVHVTAGWLDPGFHGDVTLEIANLAPWPVTLYPGERVAQLVFHQVIGCQRPYDGNYQGQRGPTPPVRDAMPDEPPAPHPGRT